MNYCHVCDEPKKELVVCECCEQDTCSDCCVDLTPHNMVDFSFCKTCDDLSTLEWDDLKKC